jgi:hypothetical protein
MSIIKELTCHTCKKTREEIPVNCKGGCSLTDAPPLFQAGDPVYVRNYVNPFFVVSIDLNKGALGAHRYNLREKNGGTLTTTAYWQDLKSVASKDVLEVVEPKPIELSVEPVACLITVRGKGQRITYATLPGYIVEDGYELLSEIPLYTEK